MGLRAMFNSISGLQSDSVWLDVIGNNVANSNTVAYKASRVEFADQLSQTLYAGGAGDMAQGLGGQNPQQVGLGTRVGSITTLFDPGSTQITGRSTDISIQGDGFLVTRRNGVETLTRAGNLSFDGDGFLVDPNGARVLGAPGVMEFNQKIINSFSSVPGQPATITQAGLQVHSNQVSSLQEIQVRRDLTLPPKATTEVKFRGNLDSFQQANVLDLWPGLFAGGGSGPVLPIAVTIAALGPAAALDTTRLTAVINASGGFNLVQVDNLSLPFPGSNVPTPIDNGIVNLGGMKFFAGSYAWDKQPPLPPAQQVSENIFDSLGNPRQITVQFYQVNDLGAGGINSPTGPSQVCYAWYAFDTSGGQPVSTANLLGGTGIGEGDLGAVFFSYDRGIPANGYAGDFLWFNTDGSLASSGGIGGPPAPPGTPNFMSMPRVYLPPFNQALPVSPLPTQGAEITSVDLNFGTFGLMTQGKRDGLYSDAEGSYQPKNGVNTYVPKHTAFAASQDGYAEGVLQDLQFLQDGTIQGNFSNGQRVGLAQVALARVQNPEGLNKVGNNGYSLSANSGPVYFGAAGSGGLGNVQGGSLESSNVQLSVELSNMIIAQRGFDTNARMIAVVNETLQVLTRLGQ